MHDEENKSTSDEDADDDAELADDDDEQQPNPWKLTREEITKFEEIFPQETPSDKEKPDTKVQTHHYTFSNSSNLLLFLHTTQ